MGFKVSYFRHSCHQRALQSARGHGQAEVLAGVGCNHFRISPSFLFLHFSFFSPHLDGPFRLRILASLTSPAMPRENSFSDSDGRSLTPDLEDEIELASPVAVSPSQNAPPALPPIQTDLNGANETRSQRNGRPSLSAKVASSPATSRRMRSPAQGPSNPMSTLTPRQKFQASVRKVIAMHRTSLMMTKNRIGAEPGVDPRRASAFLTYGHIKQKCLIEVVDYSSVRSSFGRMTNKEFITFVNNDRACEKEPWVKVRWINVGGISWDVISALALRYGE